MRIRGMRVDVGWAQRVCVKRVLALVDDTGPVDGRAVASTWHTIGRQFRLTMPTKRPVGYFSFCWARASEA
jgi:hypothetical protein